MSRITVITPGHLSTCPRMLKAAESLAADGHDVHIVSANFVKWGTAGDADLRLRLRIPCTVIDYSRESGNWLRICAGVRHRMCRALGKLLGPQRLPPFLLGCATTRILPELVKATAGIPADFLYGGGSSLIATKLAAERLKVPYAIDLEDFHGAELAATAPEGEYSNQLAQAAEKLIFSEAAFLTTASDAIADRYELTYGKRPLVINNTFPLPARKPEFKPVDASGLRLYWFSQTIGADRGLEDAVRAAGLADIECELHLRGTPIPGYLEELSSMAKECAPRLRLVHHPPQSPDQMVDLCRDYHVGLALEKSEPLNRALCLTNKAFTYILAGLAVVFTDTPGQRSLANDLGPGALLYCDVKKLAEGLRRWAENPAELLVARRSAWEAACRRWHWQHPEEEGKLLRAVRNAML